MVASADPAYFEFEFQVGEDFDQLVFLTVTKDDGTIVPYDLSNTLAGWSDVKDAPEGTLYFSGSVAPFEGDYTEPDGTVTTYTLADGAVRYSVSKELLEEVQAEDRAAGSVDLFLDLVSGQRVKVGDGRWSRFQRTTGVFA